jgi:2'-5' RNA ligase
MFDHPAYIVLELPKSISARVLDIRRRYDPHLAAFPTEITVAGSSGIGTIAADQDHCVVYQALRQVVSGHLPISSRFIGISRFATGPVVWLQPANPDPFVAIQQALVATSIHFNTHKFSYTPHCSLSSCNLAPNVIEALLQEDFPQDSFNLSVLSLYEVVDGQASLIKRFHPGLQA